MMLQRFTHRIVGAFGVAQHIQRHPPFHLRAATIGTRRQRAARHYEIKSLQHRLLARLSVAAAFLRAVCREQFIKESGKAWHERRVRPLAETCRR